MGVLVLIYYITPQIFACFYLSLHFYTTVSVLSRGSEQYYRKSKGGGEMHKRKPPPILGGIVPLGL